MVLNRIVPWEMFRERLEATRPKTQDAKRGGRRGYDVVLTFKILVLRELYALSDEPVEYQIGDRLAFQRSLGIGIQHVVLDYTAGWRFRERLKGEVIGDLFETLGGYTDIAGVEAKNGQMLDASLVAKPRTQRPPQAPEGGPALSPQQATCRGGDAAWTKKRGRSYFGYKNHVNADVAHGFIRGFAAAPASVHVSQSVAELVDVTRTEQPLYEDSAYRSAQTRERFGLKDGTQYKAQRNGPLMAQQKGEPGSCEGACTGRARVRAYRPVPAGQAVLCK